MILDTLMGVLTVIAEGYVVIWFAVLALMLIAIAASFAARKGIS